RGRGGGFGLALDAVRWLVRLPLILPCRIPSRS
ncbi:MAG: hypothetical protein QG612_1492, partial [Pseudomonadota bacterium]|nr:hypothetical protein [Pseudomonadota bacterium]